MNKPTKPSPAGETVTLPRTDYLRLKAKAEGMAALTDEELGILAKADTAGAEFLPAAMVKRILAGEPPLKIWREHRGFTQAQLAADVGSSAAYLSQLESGKRRAGRNLVTRLAAALACDPDDLKD